MRARLAIAYSQQSVELREVVLRDKPQALIDASAKATVPVLVRAGSIIDESIDIMSWALSCNDPDNWLRSDNSDQQRQIEALHVHNDNVFKYWLDRYKYADRYPEQEVLYYRQQAELTLANLEQRLAQHRYLIDDEISWADMALMPFIRQFAHTDKPWFVQSPYPRLIQWLERLMTQPPFTNIMKKYPPWQPGQTVTLFP
jgi:glutathione S-transferase